MTTGIALFSHTSKVDSLLYLSKLVKSVLIKLEYERWRYMAKVLIVDDSMFSRSMIKKVVNKIGHEAIEAANGLEGLKKIIDEKPDIVFTDLLMPEMDGVGLLTAVKEKNLEIPIVVVSANVQNTVRQQCLELGATEFFNKPPDKEKLQKYLEESFVKGDTV
jgi:two-component system chemotaxis response regulator CheY